MRSSVLLALGAILSASPTFAIPPSPPSPENYQRYQAFFSLLPTTTRLSEVQRFATLLAPDVKVYTTDGLVATTPHEYVEKFSQPKNVDWYSDITIIRRLHTKDGNTLALLVSVFPHNIDPAHVIVDCCQSNYFIRYRFQGSKIGQIEISEPFENAEGIGLK